MTRMNTAEPSRTPPRILTIVGAILAVGILAAGAGGIWYLFGRATPAAVSLPAATAATGSSAEPAASSDTSATTEPAASAAASVAASAATGAAAAGDLTGTWTVDSTIGDFADFSSSFVGYRVQEELANIGAATAVGRTPDVGGTLTVDGTTITQVDIEADLTTLESDEQRRDGQLRQQALETDTYPNAMFRLTDAIELDALPAEGETIDVTATGELTLHGVTRTVQIPLQARLADGIVTVVGSLDISFADYEIDQPRSMIVLSVDDAGVMEFQLHFSQG